MVLKVFELSIYSLL